MNRNYTIVLVEDEPLILESIRDKIVDADLGFSVVFEAVNGKQALDYMQSSAPDVLITDIGMPVMSGTELLERVETQFPHILKVIISGYSDFEYTQHAIKQKAVDYILKPVRRQDVTELLMRLRAILDSRQENLRGDHIIGENQIGISEAVEYVKGYVKQNYNTDIDFAALIQGLGYSIGYFSKVFAAEVGETPSKYQINLRMNMAKSLLAKNEFTVREVAEIVGYCEQSYFSRLFKKIVGESPASYREKEK